MHAVVTAINDNEFTVETDDVEAVRKAVKQKFPDFEKVEES